MCIVAVLLQDVFKAQRLADKKRWEVKEEKAASEAARKIHVFTDWTENENETLLSQAFVLKSIFEGSLNRM